MKFPKPLLKWVGGKTQIINSIIERFPKEMNNYHEIFLGGGSVLFAFLTLVQENAIRLKDKIYAYDINEPLIFVYKNIQIHHEELYNELKNIIDDFNKCPNIIETLPINRKPKTIEEAKQCKENYYYWKRKEYNDLKDKTTILASALFIFLNKTCFRGVFRMGPNGFNVPYGHYKNPEIINKQHLDEIHRLIKDVTFIVADFETSMQNIKEGDFAYMDPPYVPENTTSFVGYTETGFNRHDILFELCHTMKEKMILSNADVKLVRDAFPTHDITTLECRRSINSKNPNAKTKEVIIQNF